MSGFRISTGSETTVANLLLAPCNLAFCRMLMTEDRNIAANAFPEGARHHGCMPGEQKDDCLPLPRRFWAAREGLPSALVALCGHKHSATRTECYCATGASKLNWQGSQVRAYICIARSCTSCGAAGPQYVSQSLQSPYIVPATHQIMFQLM